MPWTLKHALAPAFCPPPMEKHKERKKEKMIKLLSDETAKALWSKMEKNAEKIATKSFTVL